MPLLYLDQFTFDSRKWPVYDSHTLAFNQSIVDRHTRATID